MLGKLVVGVGFATPYVFKLRDLISSRLGGVKTRGITTRGKEIFFSKSRCLTTHTGVHSEFSRHVVVIMNSFRTRSFRRLFRNAGTLP